MENQIDTLIAIDILNELSDRLESGVVVDERALARMLRVKTRAVREVVRQEERNEQRLSEFGYGYSA